MQVDLNKLQNELTAVYSKPVKLSRIYGCKDGRKRIDLSVSGETKTVQLARLIWEAENQTVIPHGMTVDHIDEDKTNDSPKNLQLLTLSENSKKGSLGNQRTLGFKQSSKQKRSGSSNGASKLYDFEVAEFRIAFSHEHLSKKEIMDNTGLSDKATRNMLYGESYKNVGLFCKPTIGRPKK